MQSPKTADKYRVEGILYAIRKAAEKNYKVLVDTFATEFENVHLKPIGQSGEISSSPESMSDSEKGAERSRKSDGIGVESDHSSSHSQTSVLMNDSDGVLQHKEKKPKMIDIEASAISDMNELERVRSAIELINTRSEIEPASVEELEESPEISQEEQFFTDKESCAVSADQSLAAELIIPCKEQEILIEPDDPTEINNIELFDHEVINPIVYEIEDTCMDKVALEEPEVVWERSPEYCSLKPEYSSCGLITEEEQQKSVTEISGGKTLEDEHSSRISKNEYLTPRTYRELYRNPTTPVTKFTERCQEKNSDLRYLSLPMPEAGALLTSGLCLPAVTERNSAVHHEFSEAENWNERPYSQIIAKMRPKTRLTNNKDQEMALLESEQHLIDQQLNMRCFSPLSERKQYEQEKDERCKAVVCSSPSARFVSSYRAKNEGISSRKLEKEVPRPLKVENDVLDHRLFAFIKKIYLENDQLSRMASRISQLATKVLIIETRIRDISTDRFLKSLNTEPEHVRKPEKVNDQRICLIQREIQEYLGKEE